MQVFYAKAIPIGKNSSLTELGDVKILVEDTFISFYKNEVSLEEIKKYLKERFEEYAFDKDWGYELYQDGDFINVKRQLNYYFSVCLECFDSSLLDVRFIFEGKLSYENKVKKMGLRKSKIQEPLASELNYLFRKMEKVFEEAVAATHSKIRFLKYLAYFEERENNNIYFYELKDLVKSIDEDFMNSFLEDYVFGKMDCPSKEILRILRDYSSSLFKEDTYSKMYLFAESLNDEENRVFQKELAKCM